MTTAANNPELGRQKSPWRAAVMLLPWLILFGASAAERQLRLEADPVDWRGGTGFAYAVFDPVEYAQVVYFKVRLTGEPGPFFVTFGGTGAPERQAALGGDRLDYRIQDSLARRAQLRELPTATASEVLRGQFRPGESVQELSYVVVVPPGQVRPSGIYTHQIRIRVYDGTPEKFVEMDAKTVPFSIRVDPVTELSLGEPGSPFDPMANVHRLEFGNLDKGKARGLGVRVRSNSGYHTTMESENGGVLRNVDPRLPSTIPYSLEIGGTAISLGRTRQTILLRNGRLTDRNGDSHELLVIIGEVGNALAGTYRDNLTLTVISDH